MTRRQPGHHCATCEACGKRIYPHRRDAKTAAKRLHPGHHLAPYRACGDRSGWHFGHLNEADRDRERRIREAS